MATLIVCHTLFLESINSFIIIEISTDVVPVENEQLLYNVVEGVDDGLLRYKGSKRAGSYTSMLLTERL